MLLHQLAHGVGVGVGVVVLILRTVQNQDLVSAVALRGLYSGVHTIADDNGNQAAALLGGQVTAGIQQLQADILCVSVLGGLDKYPEVFGLCFHFCILLR